MIVRILTHFYPNMPFKSNSRSIIKPLEDAWPWSVESCNVAYAEKHEDDSKKPSKENQVTLKMPGFVHPENLHEEGYFTEKTKTQLEEIKRNPGALKRTPGPGQRVVSEPEKKE